MKKILRSHLKSLTEGHTCLAAECPQCRNPEGQGRLTINTRTGYCFCTSCGLQGSWTDLSAYLKMKEDTKSRHGKADGPDLGNFFSLTRPSQRDHEEMLQVWNTAQPVQSGQESKLNTILHNLNLEGLSLKTLVECRARFHAGSGRLVLPVLTSSSSTTFQALKVLSPKPVPGSEMDGDWQGAPEETHLPKQHPLPLGYHLAKGKEDVVLTSTAADFLVAVQHLSVPAVCAPAGISQLPQATLAYLEPFRRISLWLDQGGRGWESARLFAKKLGEKRCHFVRPTPDTPSPLACHRSGKDLSGVLRTARPGTHKSVITFSSLRDDVYAEVVQKASVSGVRWRRFPALNELLHGHRRGELTVFTGPTGAGKTTFISEYSLDLCAQGVHTLWGSFEIRNVRLAKMMLQQFNMAALDADAGRFDAVADAFQQLPLYFLAFHGQQSVKAVLDACSYAVYVHDIGHVIIDNLQFMMGTSDSSVDRFWKQDQIVAAFRQFATAHNVHITVVIHPRKEGTEELSTSSIFGGAKASQEADNVLILQDKRLTERRKYLQVVKNRYAGDLGIMPLEFHKDSLSFAPRKKTKLARRNEDDDAGVATPSSAAASKTTSSLR